MNFLNVFEERIAGIFGSSSQAAAPLSFKKLAKKASSEMENETYVINGVDTAPALFTVLVSQADDTAMRPLYANLTEETALFLEAHAQRRGYTFVGQPLVRFMVDPALKHGKFSVFAENVDARTLDRLREEERAYTGAPAGQSRPEPQAADLDLGLGPIGTPAADPSQDGLDVMSPDTVLDVVEDAYAMGHDPAAPLPAGYRSPGTPVPPAQPRAGYMGSVSPSDEVRAQQARARHDDQRLAAPAPVPAPAPATQRRTVPLGNLHARRRPAHRPSVGPHLLLHLRPLRHRPRAHHRRHRPARPQRQPAPRRALAPRVRLDHHRPQLHQRHAGQRRRRRPVRPS